MDYDRDYKYYNRSYERKPRIISTVLLAVFCALLGGLIAVVLVPKVYPQIYAQADISDSGNRVILHQGGTPPLASASGSEKSPVVDIASTVGPAVVGVANFQYRGSFLGSTTGLTEVGSGSGFIINAEHGYIVTNNHVITGAEKIMISLADGRNLPGTLVGKDPRTDLAVVKIEDTHNLRAVQLGDSNALEVGQPVVAIGNPGGEAFARTVTTGVISATDRFLSLEGEASFSLIQTDAAINPGNSGGPLVNYSGQVIGINSAKNQAPGFEGMGFAIPISDALPVIQQIIEKGYVSHPALQVNIDQRYTPEYASYRGWPAGTYISQVQPGGAAHKAGLRSGDIITAINNTVITNALELTHQLFKYKPGDTVKVTFYRNGNTDTVNVKLGEIRSQ
ncbi:MAG: PDZ domain-containing protein [Peptococcaceae bacterium]|jgi:serine protease Do|nr:PDZ domain-containing protein [Peptococcaceae bacterium]